MSQNEKKVTAESILGQKSGLALAVLRTGDDGLDFSTKRIVICKVYTDLGGMKYLCHGYRPVREKIHSLVEYLHVHADNHLFLTLNVVKRTQLTHGKS